MVKNSKRLKEVPFSYELGSWFEHISFAMPCPTTKTKYVGGCRKIKMSCNTTGRIVDVNPHSSIS